LFIKWFEGIILTLVQTEEPNSNKAYFIEIWTSALVLTQIELLKRDTLPCVRIRALAQTEGCIVLVNEAFGLSNGHLDLLPIVSGPS